MIEAVKKLWIEALRSGEFKQGTHCLRNKDGGYCCLGVLTELYRREVMPTTDWQVNVLDYSFLDNRLTLPHKVKEWAGLPDYDPCIIDSDGCTRLLSSGMNDAGHSFKTIADIIETTPLVARLRNK